MEKGWLMPYELYNSLLKEFPLFEDRYTYDNSVASRGVHFCKNVDVSKLSESERMVHETMSVLFTSDLLIQRELVRHREASFAGESTRYCNYSLDKFGNEITVIKPCFEEGSEAYNEWLLSCKESERSYFALLNLGVAPQLARDVLPASTKCDTVVTANLSEWKHIFDLRACDATGAAHPKMKQIMIPLLKEVRPKYEFAFSNLITSDDIITI
jgi:thymidylate synthase (FAD)